jgi:Rps23 Pro-64 3,4-dihydroxylase Tpa1-like proline 4-hydroxylase
MEGQMNMQHTLTRKIVERLEREEGELAREFTSMSRGVRTRHVAIDHLLPEEIALDFYHCFPPKESMRYLSSFRERKYTFKQLDQVPLLLKDITLAIQSPEVVAIVERITGLPQQIPDLQLYAGGISLMARDNFLNPHIDNSHDHGRKLYRTLNLLYYVSPGWKAEYGGSLELWDVNVKNAVVIPSLFNRLVIMETNRHSWHSVSPVRHEGQRCCVSNYYFSERSPEGVDYFHVTSFSARPEQVIRRWVATADNLARMGIRMVIKKGVGRTDLYRPNQPE